MNASPLPLTAAEPDVLAWDGPNGSGVIVRNTPENRAAIRDAILARRAEEAAKPKPAPVQSLSEWLADLAEVLPVRMGGKAS